MRKRGNMLRIAVCNMVLPGVERLAEYLGMWSYERNVVARLMSFQSGEEVLFEMEISGDFAVVFIGMGPDNIAGIETALSVKRQNRLTNIVFLVESMQYLKEMLQIYPVQFVFGQITRKKIFEAMDRFWNERRYLQENFFFRFNHRSYMIDLSEVLYFSSEGRVVEILLETGRRYRVYTRLDTVEQNLLGSRVYFIRIHQSYLVNSRHIEQFCYSMVRLRNCDELPVSRKRRGEIVGFYRECVLSCQKMT